MGIDRETLPGICHHSLCVRVCVSVCQSSYWRLVSGDSSLLFLINGSSYMKIIFIEFVLTVSSIKSTVYSQYMSRVFHFYYSKQQ